MTIPEQTLPSPVMAIISKACFQFSQDITYTTMTGYGSSCGACKFLRRRCTTDCVFAPYFYYDQAAAHFAAVHKVFGASNVSRLLSHLPVPNRSDAAISISYEALARVHDPIYGCVSHIFALQQQVASLQEEIDVLSVMMNSSVGGAACASSRAPTNWNNGVQLSRQHDASGIQNYQQQFAALICEETSAKVFQSLEGQREMNMIEFASSEHGLEESNLNPLERLLA